MDHPCSHGATHSCRQCTLEQPCRRFAHHRRAVQGHVSELPDGLCRRCSADNLDEKRFEDWNTSKASTWIGQHIPKFVKTGHLPAMADLEPSRARLTAQRRFLAERYQLTPQTLGQKFLEAWPSKCPGPCEKPFQGMQHGYRSMTGDRLRHADPPYPLNIICLCDTCNGQKKDKDFAVWQEDLYWDRLWKEARVAYKATRPEQLRLEL